MLSNFPWYDLRSWLGINIDKSLVGIFCLRRHGMCTVAQTVHVGVVVAVPAVSVDGVFWFALWLSLLCSLSSVICRIFCFPFWRPVCSLLFLVSISVSVNCIALHISVFWSSLFYLTGHRWDDSTSPWAELHHPPKTGEPRPDLCLTGGGENCPLGKYACIICSTHLLIWQPQFCHPPKVWAAEVIWSQSCTIWKKTFFGFKRPCVN